MLTFVMWWQPSWISHPRKSRFWNFYLCIISVQIKLVISGKCFYSFSHMDGTVLHVTMPCRSGHLQLSMQSGGHLEFSIQSEQKSQPIYLSLILYMILMFCSFILILSCELNFIILWSQWKYENKCFYTKIFKLPHIYWLLLYTVNKSLRKTIIDKKDI